MFEAKTSYAKIAFEAILYYLTTGNIKSVNSDEIPADLKLKIPCFVAVFDDQNNLRGIAGTTEMESDNLYDEITKKAIEAAKDGVEKNQISVADLNSLKTEVYLLSSIGKLETEEELKPQKTGLILNRNDQRFFLLPHVDNTKRQEKMLSKLFKKANLKYSGNINDYDIDSFRITRYD